MHAGHVQFALQAMEQSELDAVYFLPERKPRYKRGVEHFGHRVAMLKRACEPHPRLSVLELDDVSFTIRRTLPALQKMFSNSTLVFLFGSDAVKQLSSWSHSEKLLQTSELVIGVRSSEKLEDIQRLVDDWPVQQKTVTLLHSASPEVSSTNIRDALRQRQQAPGALMSVQRYSNQNWLYVSIKQ